MNCATVGRITAAVSLAVLLPRLSQGQQRMAPLPPDCTVPGSSPVAALARTAQQASLAVLPLNIGTGAGPLMYLSDALPGGIANRIALSVPRIYVVGRRVQRRRRPATPAEFHALSSELGVRYVLDGGITGAQGSTQIFLALYEVTSGRQVWHRTFSVDSAGALPVEQSAAIEIASRIGGALSAGEKQRLRLVPTAHHVAYDLALRGDASADDPGKAADAYRSALRADPNFADGYARLAIADASLLETGAVSRDSVDVTRKELRYAAARAITIDSTSALAWLAEARSRMLGGRPATASSQAFEHAASLDPTSPLILKEYGRMLSQAGERAHAAEVLQHARSMDPGRAEVVMLLGEIAMVEHRDGEACTLLNRAIFDDALLAPAWALRALVRARHDDLRFAWADAETAERLGNPFLGESSAALVDLVARDTVRARERLQSLWEQVQARGAVGVREGRSIAVALLATHQPKRALDVLEAVRASGPWYAATLRDSNFDSVRNEPRFRALATAQAGT